mgnify:CR=1 FL=1
MTRRGFFRLLSLAAVTAPATATLVPEKLSRVRSWLAPFGQWAMPRVSRWRIEFDYGRVLRRPSASSGRGPVDDEGREKLVRVEVA